MLRTSKTVAERADSYFKSMKRDIQKEVLDSLIEKREKIVDEIFELSTFTLETNYNRGNVPVTKEDCKARFVKIIDMEFELELINIELSKKQASFDKYFPEEVENASKEA